jgi:hypothetical protein
MKNSRRLRVKAPVPFHGVIGVKTCAMIRRLHSGSHDLRAAAGTQRGRPGQLALYYQRASNIESLHYDGGDRT